MSKVALISDIHFGEHKNDEAFMNMQLAYFRNFFIPKCRENGVTEIYILGDLLHDRRSLNINLKTNLQLLFTEMANEFPVHCLVGNHDIYYKDSNSVNGLRFLDKSIKNFHLYTQPIVLNRGDKKIFIAPWVHKKMDFRKEVSDIGVKCDYCFGHFELSGFKLNRKVIARGHESGDSLGDWFKYVFSGHYHTRSNAIVGGALIQYLGSPFSYDRNDINDDKGFVILDLETSDYEFVESENIFRFLSYSYSPELELDPKIIANSYVDITIDRELLHDKVYHKFREKLNAMKPLKVNQIIQKKEAVSSLKKETCENDSEDVMQTSIYNSCLKTIDRIKIVDPEIRQLVKTSIESLAKQARLI